MIIEAAGWVVREKKSTACATPSGASDGKEEAAERAPARLKEIPDIILDLVQIRETGRNVLNQSNS
jgi:hypothetical protein